MTLLDKATRTFYLDNVRSAIELVLADEWKGVENSITVKLLTASVMDVLNPMLADYEEIAWRLENLEK
jgi:hypothetical protein